MTDDVDMRRRRALYRANHRGTKEIDHVVGRFAEARLDTMDVAALDRFERFLALPDPLLQRDSSNRGAVPLSEFADLVAEVRAFHGLAATKNGTDE